MADSSAFSTPSSTPKRKRTLAAAEEAPSPIHPHFSFDVSTAPPPVSDAGSDSPRTKVAHRFRGLALGDQDHSGGGVASADASRGITPPPQRPAELVAAADWMNVDQDESKMRKRPRNSSSPDDAGITPQADTPMFPAKVSATPNAQASQPHLLSGDAAAQQPRFAPIDDDNARAHKANTTAYFTIDHEIIASSPKPSPAKLPRSHAPASTRQVDALKPRGRKRAGTPPVTAKRGIPDHPGGTESDAVDPVRAALTWKEDEITIYDPDDEDDDGVGINGIGFKPTPAIAHSRVMKRKQQLAEYKKREEREARAKRSLRRRGSPERPSSKLDRKENARKVRFTEADPPTMIGTC